MAARAAKQVMIFNHVANGEENGLGGQKTREDSIMRPTRMREAIRKKPVRTGNFHNTTFENQFIGDYITFLI